MKTADFLANFERVRVSPALMASSEIRFVVKGVEMRVAMVRLGFGDGVTWTVDLDNDPATAGTVVTSEEAEAAFRDRTIEEG